jgi:hypothetical protein
MRVTIMFLPYESNPESARWIEVLPTFGETDYTFPFGFYGLEFTPARITRRNPLCGFLNLTVERWSYTTDKTPYRHRWRLLATKTPISLPLDSAKGL